MAEQFLSRLQDIEKSIGALDDTLKRMVTILANMDEIRSDIRLTRDELLDAIKSVQAPTADTGGSLDHVADLVKGQFDQIATFIGQAIEALKEDMLGAMMELQDSPPIVAAAPAPTPASMPATSPAAPAPDPEVVVTQPAAMPTTVPIPADKAMKIADELDNIVASLKMGCKAGDVIDQIDDSKANIAKIVESDPVMIKIDQWKGIVAAYPKRKELQARDILKIKKGIRAEVPKYRPA
ncbi:MAG: hypothetical protein AM326_00580 [Candidatus Thorarchaeota archaeon SMTZ-45]|nr:MAG: hypothetical protein AM326_00580 [Candidatus Thorarchaeota archaeon SMTZ-45]